MNHDKQLQIINRLKELQNIPYICVNLEQLKSSVSDINEIINFLNIEKPFLLISEYDYEHIDITDDIIDTIIDTIEYLEEEKKPSKNKIKGIPDCFKLSEEELNLIQKYENKYIPKEGKSKFLIGEILRAIQYIEYRFINDGELPYNIISSSYPSYLFLKFIFNQINEQNFNGEMASYTLQLSERFEDFFDNKLDVILDGFILGECSIMKLAIIHLIETKQIQLNKLNNFESRNFVKS